MKQDKSAASAPKDKNGESVSAKAEVSVPSNLKSSDAKIES